MGVGGVVAGVRVGGKGKVIVSEGTQLRQREAAGNVAIAHNVQIAHCRHCACGGEGGTTLQLHALCIAQIGRGEH